RGHGPGASTRGTSRPLVLAPGPPFRVPSPNTPSSALSGDGNEAIGRPTRRANFDCLHAIWVTNSPIPHVPQDPILSPSTNRMRQVCNSWGRGGPRTPGSPRSKPLEAFEKIFFGAFKIFPHNPVGPGSGWRDRAGCVVSGNRAGHAGIDP